MRNKPSVGVIQREFKMYGHPIGLEKAEEVQAMLEKAALVTGQNERDVLETLAVNAKSGALDRLSVMVGDEG